MRTLLLILSFASLLILADSASGQIRISNPETPGAVQQTSLSTSNPVSARLSDIEVEVTTQRIPIRVAIQYLQVDSQTRKQIYEQLQPASASDTPRFKLVRDLPTPEPSMDLDDPSLSQPIAVSKRLMKPSHMTTGLIESTELKQMVDLVKQSEGSEIKRAPSVLVLSGKSAELNDIAQHPFVVGFTYENGSAQPEVKVLESGRRIRLLATARSPNPTSPVHLKAEFVASRVLDVGTNEVLGFGKEPVSVQTPTLSVSKVMVTEEVEAGQSVLIDPHLVTQTEVQVERSTPLIGKIPYVGRSFKNVDSTTVDQYLLVLLTPSIEKPKD